MLLCNLLKRLKETPLKITQLQCFLQYFFQILQLFSKSQKEASKEFCSFVFSHFERKNEDKSSLINHLICHNNFATLEKYPLLREHLISCFFRQTHQIPSKVIADFCNSSNDNAKASEPNQYFLFFKNQARKKKRFSSHKWKGSFWTILHV